MNGAQTKWAKELQKGLSLVCFKPGTQEIIGVNILEIKNSSSGLPVIICFQKSKTQDFPFFSSLILQSACDVVFKKYSVQKYLLTHAIVVHPDYREKGIGKALLRGNEEVCSNCGVRVTAGLFISDSSIILADKLYYTTVYRER